MLCYRFDGVTKNFKLYYDGQHYVGEKRFEAVQDLVADGLITFYLESKAADYIADLSNQSNYAESPYVAYNTLKKKQLAAPRSTRHPTPTQRGDAPSRRQQPPEPSSGEQWRKRGSSRAEREPRDVEQSKRADRTDGEQGNRSPAPEGDVTRAANRRSTANLPIDSPRISHIIENRHDANVNVSVGKKDSKHSSSSQAQSAAENSQARSHAVPTSGQQQQQQLQPPAAQSSEAALAKLSEHEYANQLQIQLHRQQQEAAQQQRRPQHAAAAGADVTASPAADARVTSATNTDGPVRLMTCGFMLSFSIIFNFGLQCCPQTPF